MKIRIYQVDAGRDINNLSFRNLEYVYTKSGERFPEEIYKLVYYGEIEPHSLDELFLIFNQHPPATYYARKLSISDVLEIIHSQEKSSFYFVDSIGFVLIPFDKTKVGKTL